MSNDVVLYIILAVLFLIAALVLVLHRKLHKGQKFGDTFDIEPGVATPVSEEERPIQTEIKGRFFGFGAIAAAAFSALGFRLWQMQLLDGEKYVMQAEQNRTRTVSTPAPRGRILDRNGIELVGNRSSLVVLAEPDVANEALLVRRLSNLLGIPAAIIKRKISDTTAGTGSMRTIAYDVPLHTASYIVEHPDQFFGIEIDSQPIRTYPQGISAAHVLGYTGTISREQMEAQQERIDNNELKEGEIVYSYGDIVGKTGIELQYESVLQGIAGQRTVYVDAHGRVTGQVDEIPPISGSDVRLTIDLTIQQALEQALVESYQTARDTGSKNVTGASGVVMDPNTGEVIALANVPTYSPNSFIGGIGSETWRLLTDEQANNPLSNRAISGAYPAASTIKPFSTFSALEHGIISGNDSFHCPGWWTGFGEQWGKWCWLHSGHGGINVVRGIAVSCDSVFYDIAKAMFYSDTPEGLQATYRKWGFGSKTGIDLPSEIAGRVPDAEWKRKHFKNYNEVDRKWMAGDTANLVIGQGDLLVTPLQLAQAYCGITQGGTAMRPHVLREVLGATGEVVTTKEPEVSFTIEVPEEHLALVRQGLADSVKERAPRAIFSDISTPIAGKSGTGQVANKDDYAYFVAYIPVDNPKYVMSVIVEQGGFGTTVAGPVVAKTFASILGQKIDDIGVVMDESR